MLNIVQLIVAFTLISLLASHNSNGAIDSPRQECFLILGVLCAYAGAIAYLTYRQIRSALAARQVIDDLWRVVNEEEALLYQRKLKKTLQSTSTKLIRGFDLSALALLAGLLLFTEVNDLMISFGIWNPTLIGFALVSIWVACLAMRLCAEAYMLRHLHSRALHVGKYVGLNLILTLVALAPMLLIHGLLYSLSVLFPDIDLALNSFAFLEPFLLLVFIALIFWVLPIVIRAFLPTTPISNTKYGNLERALRERTKAPVDKTFVIRTKPGGIKSALMIGIGWPFRFVFVTQALCEALSDDEVEAVIAHEFGHAKRLHLPQMLGFMATFVLLELAIVFFFGEIPLGGNPAWVNSDMVDLMSVASVPLFLLGFGYLSRRCEREADFFAARYCGPQAIQNALTSLARTADINPNKKGWRHFSIARRVQELESFDPDQLIPKKGWKREKSLTTGLIACVFLGLSVYLFPFVVHDFLTGEATFLIHKAEAFHANGDMENAREAHKRAFAHISHYLEREDLSEELRGEQEFQAAFQETLGSGQTTTFDRLIENAKSSEHAKAIRSLRYLYLLSYLKRKPPHEIDTEDPMERFSRY